MGEWQKGSVVRGQDEQPQSLAVHQGVARRAHQAAALEQAPGGRWLSIVRSSSSGSWLRSGDSSGSVSTEGTRAGQPLEAEASVVPQPGPAATAGLEGSRR